MREIYTGFSVVIYGERILNDLPSRIIWNNFYQMDNSDEAMDKAKKDFSESNPEHPIILCHIQSLQSMMSRKP